MSAPASQAPSIAVVVSTYNGEGHLAEQLDSVLTQKGVPGLRVLVRDDGSTDGTLDLLAGYERRGDITLVRGENLGVVGSFLDAIARVPRDVPFIALCDQDDVWHEDKLARALSVLSSRDQTMPQAYCSEYIFCDADMAPQGRSHHNRIGVTFPTMLYEDMACGNTMVFNRALADAVINVGRAGVYCHDWWIALLATALGELAFDDFMSLDYRRTGSNASPTGKSGLALLAYRIKTFFGKGEFGDITAQLELLRDAFGNELAPEKRALLDRMLDGGRIAKALTPVRLRQKPVEELALRLLFLMGKL